MGQPNPQVRSQTAWGNASCRINLTVVAEKHPHLHGDHEGSKGLALSELGSSYFGCCFVYLQHGPSLPFPRHSTSYLLGSAFGI